MPRSILLDSDILIDHLRKERISIEFIENEIEENSLLFLSVISRTEIYAGFRKGEEESVNSLFDIITPVNVDSSIADKAGDYLNKFSKSHALNIGDAIIAATASEMGLILVTRNIKHYPMRDISVEKPY